MSSNDSHEVAAPTWVVAFQAYLYAFSVGNTVLQVKFSSEKRPNYYTADIIGYTGALTQLAK